MTGARPTVAGSSAAYESKPHNYYSGARRSFVDMLPVHPAGRLLEIGCGNGDTAAYALSKRKCGTAVGVELCETPGTEAASRLTDVVIGDVETIELPYPSDYFDVLIMSEVLEHLRNPASVLRRLRSVLRPGALVMAGSPNVSHHSVLRMLVRGRWDYRHTGIMDDTHLRWFTPATYRLLFESAGYLVDFVGPARPLSRKSRIANYVTGGRLEYLLYSQIHLRATRP